MYFPKTFLKIGAFPVTERHEIQSYHFNSQPQAEDSLKNP